MFDWFNDLSEKTIEKLFLKLIDDFDTKDLEFATKNNVSLLMMTYEYRPRLLNFATGVAGNFREQGHMLNMDNAMGWLKEKRKDLWINVVTSEEKKVWMKSQVDDFREFLFEKNK